MRIPCLKCLLPEWLKIIGRFKLLSAVTLAVIAGGLLWYCCMDDEPAAPAENVLSAVELYLKMFAELCADAEGKDVARKDIDLLRFRYYDLCVRYEELSEPEQDKLKADPRYRDLLKRWRMLSSESL